MCNQFNKEYVNWYILALYGIKLIFIIYYDYRA